MPESVHGKPQIPSQQHVEHDVALVQQGGTLSHSVAYPVTGPVCELTEEVALRAMQGQDSHAAQSLSAGLMLDAAYDAQRSHDASDTINTLAAGLIKFRPSEESKELEQDAELDEEEEAQEEELETGQADNQAQQGSSDSS